MKRTYAIKIKSSKLLKTEEQIKEVEDRIKETASECKSVELSDEGQIATVEVEKVEDFVAALNAVVNVFRKIDDKSEVSYKFALNNR